MVIKQFLNNRKRARRLATLKRARSLMKTIRSDANEGIKKNALRSLCRLASPGGFHMIIEEGWNDYVDITLSNGYEISGRDYFADCALEDAASDLVKYIRAATT